MTAQNSQDALRKERSYTAGMSMPWKLLRSETAIAGGVIRPEHIRLFPTYRCNAACSFCGVRNWPKNEELSTRELLEIVRHFHALGTRAITVSGGGEPTLHSGFDALLDLCRELDIHVGLITNGLLWSDKRKTLSANGKLLWARMSVVDAESGTYDVERLRRFSENLSDVAVGCYVTITKDADVDFIERLADMAEELPNVTHFKLGENSLEGASEKMDAIERRIRPGRDKLLIQKKSEAGEGTCRCLVSLLRPVVSADGYVYPCCNLELRDAGYVEPTVFRMGHWREFGPDAKPFDGSICQKCIWAPYNHVLDGLTTSIEHERFL